LKEQTVVILIHIRFILPQSGCEDSIGIKSTFRLMSIVTIVLILKPNEPGYCSNFSPQIYHEQYAERRIACLTGNLILFNTFKLSTVNYATAC
jgi:hypothetical protein